MTANDGQKHGQAEPEDTKDARPLRPIRLPPPSEKPPYMITKGAPPPRNNHVSADAEFK